MSKPRLPRAEEVEHLLRNARLRDELEPFLDDSITGLKTDEMPTPVENEYLASILAWERAPTLPISQWFEPELRLPAPDELDDEQLRELLSETVHKLYSRRIVLDFTDHLSDRQLYTLIYRDILPSYEKHIENSEVDLHWDCADTVGNPDTWLRHYATDEERQNWVQQFGESIPPHEPPPYPRNLPRRPL